MQQTLRHALIREDALSVDALLAKVRDPEVGGVGLFVGLVRDHDHGESVVGLDYSQHPTAGAELAASVERTAAAYPGTRIAVEHRVGHLAVGDLAVVVAVGAAHRGPALQACRMLIDDLKQTVPIWKRQELTRGVSEWVGL